MAFYFENAIESRRFDLILSFRHRQNFKKSMIAYYLYGDRPGLVFQKVHILPEITKAI